MDKVTITKEQAESIEKFLGNANPSRASLLQLHATGEWMGLHYKSLNLLSVDEMARALYIGYEIEKQKFQPGDKVIQVVLERGEKLSISVLEKLKEGTGEEAWWYEGGMWDYTIDFRHATPEEIYWLETLGREKVADFRMGDVYKLGGGKNKTVDLGTKIDLLKHSYHIGNLIGIYPAESFKPFPEVSKS